MYSMIMIGVLALIVLISVAHAAIFGQRRAITRLVVFVLSAVAAIGTCLLIKHILPTPDTLISLIENNLTTIESIFQNYLGMSVTDIIAQGISYAEISPTLVELAIQLAGALILPLTCMILFLGYAAAAWLVCMIVFACKRHAEKKRARAMDEEYKPASGSRWLAASLGLVQGFVIVIMLLIPISGYLLIAEPTLNELTAQDVIDADDPYVQLSQEIVIELNGDQVLHTYRMMGGEFLSDTMMNLHVAGMNVKTSEELGSLIILAQQALELSETEFKDYSEEQAAIIRSIGDSFGDSKLLAPIVGDILYAATDAWLNGETFLGYDMPSPGENAEMFEPFVIALLEILHDDAKDAQLLQTDVKTVAEMLAIMAQHKVFANLSDTDQLLGTLGNDGVITSLITVLGTNNSMKRLIPEAMNLGVRAIGQILSIPESTAVVYNSFMDTVTSKLNEVRDLSDEQRIAALSEQLESSFDQAGLDVDAEVLDFYATAMLHDLADSDAAEITTADVQAFFALYAEGAVQTTASLSTTPRFDLLTATEQSDPYAGTIYADMTDRERLQTAAYAVATLCVKLSKLDTAATDLEQQAKALVVETFTDLLGEESAALEVVSNVKITAPVSGTSVEHAASMQSSDALKETSTVITLEVLLVDSKEAALKITAESIESDALAITAIFNAATDLKDVLGTGTSDANMDIASLATSVGTILDSLAQTEAFGKDNTANLFTAVLQSETVRDMAGLDMKTATQLAEKATEGDVNYSQTMGVIAGSVNIMETLAADGKISDEELVDLIKNLNPQTAGMIEVYVTPARLVENNIPEKYSEISSELIKSIFSYMGREDLEDYDAEAKALNQILQIALAAKSSDDSKLFGSAPGAEDGKLPTAKETVDILLDSDAVRFAVVDVMTDGQQVTVFDPYELSGKIKPESQDYKDCVAAVEEYRAAHPDTPDLVIEAMCALLGVRVDLAQ